MWGVSASEESGRGSSTDVTSVSVGARTDSVTVQPSPRTSVISSGVLTATEFRRISNGLSYFALTLEPIAMVLLTLSALAFLKDRHFVSNCYLAAVCLFETWYILMLFSHYLVRQWPKVYSSRTFTQVSVWTVSYSALAARRCVYLLNGLVSLQRFLAIAFPLKFRRFRLLQKPSIPLVAIFLFTFLLNLHRPLQFSAVPFKDGKSKGWTIGYSDLFREQRQVFLAFADLSRYLVLYIPMLVALVSNCLMLFALSRHNKDLSKMNDASSQKEQDTNKNKAERQMTVTILVSTFLMVLFNTPTNINEAVSMYSQHYGVVKRDHYLYIVVRTCFSLVSQLCDVLIALSYLVLSAAFRRRFFSLLTPLRHALPCRRTPDQSSASASDASSSAVNSRVNTATMEMDSVTK
ncbi:hypothetical protein ACOMHN_019805 [Nucella lapillus]